MSKGGRIPTDLIWLADAVELIAQVHHSDLWAKSALSETEGTELLAYKEAEQAWRTRSKPLEELGSLAGFDGYLSPLAKLGSRSDMYHLPTEAPEKTAVVELAQTKLDVRMTCRNLAWEWLLDHLVNDALKAGCKRSLEPNLEVDAEVWWKEENAAAYPRGVVILGKRDGGKGLEVGHPYLKRSDLKALLDGERSKDHDEASEPEEVPKLDHEAAVEHVKRLIAERGNQKPLLKQQEIVAAVEPFGFGLQFVKDLYKDRKVIPAEMAKTGPKGGPRKRPIPTKN